MYPLEQEEPVCPFKMNLKSVESLLGEQGGLSHLDNVCHPAFISGLS